MGSLSSLGTTPSAGRSPWQPESGQDGMADVRWIQSSLNTVLGWRLDVDGIAGPATRSAVRSFQAREGLVPDGVVGPLTRAALERAQQRGGGRPAVASAAETPRPRPGEACTVLDDFDFDNEQLKPEHLPRIASLARQIVNGRIAAVRIVGHTDPVGDVNYNIQLGQRRAQQAATALRRKVDALKPGSGSQLSISIASVGEAASGSGNPARERRVEICLPPVSIDPGLPGNPDPRPIPTRLCCLLAPQQINSVRSNDNIVDPARLGQHGAWSEVNGIVYCGKAGFVDLSHLRDSCDTTKFIFDKIVSIGRVPLAISVRYQRLNPTPRIVGTAVIHRRPLRPIDVARVIAYDVGLGHEIATYYDMGVLGRIDIGGHNSSFSPEDLCSNYLGTWIAERAITAGGSFNDAVTTALNALVRTLDGQTPAETLKAFNLINGRWVMFSRSHFYESITRPDYLRRRNFTRLPWAAGHRSDKPPPSFVTAALPDPGPGVYAYTHREETSTVRLNALYPRYIQQIQQDARQRYGPRFDRPN